MAIPTFVVPFYGEDIGGGAETFCRRLAENCAVRGVPAEVLTTTIRQPGDSWNAFYHEYGVYDYNGVTVRRFPPRHMDPDRFLAITGKLSLKGKITREEEVEYADNVVNSGEMYTFIGDNAPDRIYFFLPYLFGTSLNGSKISPHRSFLIPCLHDEGFAHLSITREMFSRVNAAFFLAKAEMRLAERLYGGLHHTEKAMLGCGVDQIDPPDPERFRKTFEVGEAPFIFYVGRRGAGKNTPLLVDFFHRYKMKNKNSRLKLVFAGPGNDPIPPEIKDDVIDTGFISSQDKSDGLAAASILCQPSVMESFSIVIMESWLAGTPVLVNSGCAVTSEHAKESGGGFSFGSFAEFAEQVDLLLGNKTVATKMGERGCEYVNKNYAWPIITKRFIQFVDTFS